MRPTVLFAHGAGAGTTHPWMRAWAERLSVVGDVRTFDYPYMAAGRRAPDRLPKLILAHEAALAELREEGRPVWLMGKSMGSRVGCHVATNAAVTGLVCFGYPLVGSKGAVRDAVLLALSVPILFVQGSKDRLCPLDQLASVRARMTARSSLHVVEGGDHSLRVGKRALAAMEATQEQVDAAALAAVAGFVAAYGTGS